MVNELNTLNEERKEFEGIYCSEEYFFVEDLYYFIKLALAFVS